MRVEILADEGPDFTYDLSFQVVTKSDITDIVRTTNGLKVIVPAKDAVTSRGCPRLRGRRAGPAQPEPTQADPARHPHHRRRPRPPGALRGRRRGEPGAGGPRRLRHVRGPRRRGPRLPHDGRGCHGCSMSRMTMLQGVQTMIADAVPGIDKVIDATDHSTGETPTRTRPSAAPLDNPRAVAPPPCGGAFTPPAGCSCCRTRWARSRRRRDHRSSGRRTRTGTRCTCPGSMTATLRTVGPLAQRCAAVPAVEVGHQRNGLAGVREVKTTLVWPSRWRFFVIMLRVCRTTSARSRTAGFQYVNCACPCRLRPL